MMDLKNMLRLCGIGLIFALAACGSDGRGDDESGRAAPATSVVCAVENDCDEDGVFSTCDEDDTNANLSEVLEDCDADQDGFADTPCTAFEDIDGDGVFGESDRLEYGVNCDVCPGMTDPEQADADADGVGDLCALEPDINIGAVPPAPEEVPAD